MSCFRNIRVAASISDYRELAPRRLPKFLFEYADGGSYDEVTLHRNRADLQHMLRDVSDIDLGIEIFGQRQSMPIALGPIGLAGILPAAASGRLSRRPKMRAFRSACRPYRPVHWRKWRAAHMVPALHDAQSRLRERSAGGGTCAWLCGARLHRRYAGARRALSRLPVRPCRRAHSAIAEP